jgi:hypothetical protein
MHQSKRAAHRFDNEAERKKWKRVDCENICRFVAFCSQNALNRSECVLPPGIRRRNLVTIFFPLSQKGGRGSRGHSKGSKDFTRKGDPNMVVDTGEIPGMPILLPMTPRRMPDPPLNINGE